VSQSIKDGRKKNCEVSLDACNPRASRLGAKLVKFWSISQSQNNASKRVREKGLIIIAARRGNDEAKCRQSCG